MIWSKHATYSLQGAEGSECTRECLSQWMVHLSMCLRKEMGSEVDIGRYLNES